MTVVFSAASSEWVVMAADSAVTREFEQSREYDSGRKIWAVDGVGVLGTWGSSRNFTQYQ